MTNASETLRACPTRADGYEVLIAHSISGEICQERQRRIYHKCFTCVHRGVGAHAVAAPAPRPLAALDGADEARRTEHAASA